MKVSASHGLPPEVVPVHEWRDISMPFFVTFLRIDRYLVGGLT